MAVAQASAQTVICLNSADEGSESDSSHDVPSPKKRQKKKSTDADKKSSTVPEPMLPPCRICSEKASGFHYGANTCEACKAFFRRSLRKGAQYKCAADGCCKILAGQRNSCPACRLKKCIDIGMSKSAIKTGRYTHAKKARDIMEVKSLQESKDMKVFSPDTMTRDELSCSDTQNSPGSAKAAGIVNSTLHSGQASHYLNASTPSDVWNSTNSVPEASTPGSSGSSRPPKSPPASVEELMEIVTHITNVNRKQTHYTAEWVSRKLECEKVFLEQKALHTQIFGTMEPVTHDEYNIIYKSTGIDIDGRRDLLQTAFLPYINDCVKRYVTFVKSIPGFHQLPINDQISLVKASRFDVWMILGQKAFNPRERLYTNNDCRVVSIDEMVTLSNDRDTNELVFYIQDKIQKLQLNDEENCTLAAMSVMATDHCTLEDAEQVGRCHALLLECFLYLISKYHSDDRLFIARVVGVLTELRSVRESHKFIEEQLAQQWSDKVEFPPLLYEMWSSA